MCYHGFMTNTTTKFDNAVEALAAVILARVAFDDAQDQLDAGDPVTVVMRETVTLTHAAWYGCLVDAERATRPLSPKAQAEALTLASERFKAVAT